MLKFNPSNPSRASYRLESNSFAFDYNKKATYLVRKDSVINFKELLGGLAARSENPFHPKFHGIAKATYRVVELTNKATYKGFCVGNFFHGYGKIDFKDGSYTEGEFKEGKFTGFGKVKIVENDSIYEGDYKDFKREGLGSFKSEGKSTYYHGHWSEGNMTGSGQGRLVNNDGGFYEGALLNKQAFGRGIMVLYNGDYYLGYFKDNQIVKVSRVRVTEKSGLVYEGEVKDGVLNGAYHGQGKITYPNGEYYEGGFKDNLKYGPGYVHRTFGGDEFKGEVLNGLMDGVGTLKMANGESYSGHWKKGCYEGRGKLVSYNGDFEEVLEGEFKNGVFTGTGYIKKLFEDKLVYEGLIKDLAWHSSGNLRKPNGVYYLGNWNNNEWEGEGLVRRSDEQGVEWYEGQVSQDDPHGFGRVMNLFDQGINYLGDFYKGEYHGTGLHFVSLNSWYYGKSSDNGDLTPSIAMFKISDHAQYVGSILNGESVIPHGIGLIMNGQKREAMHFNQGIGSPSNKLDLKDGSIIFYSKTAANYTITIKQYKNGDFYIGFMTYLAENGPGIMLYQNGDFHLGIWKDGKPYGFGVAKTTYPSGAVYEGNVKGIIPDGIGRLKEKDGKEVYAGLWQKGKAWEKSMMLEPFEI